MPAPSWENLDDFFQSDDDGGFAFTATIHSQKGWSRDIVGIFDDPYYNSQIGEYEADGAEPRLTAKESDFAGVLRGDTVTVAGETFDVVRSADPDGTGTACLKLARQNAKLRN